MTDRIAYTVDNVLYLVERGYMAALWTSDPAVHALGAQAAFNRLTDRSVEVELIADMTLNRKSEGSLYSGWMPNAQGNALDPIRRKAEALLALRELVAAEFARRSAAPAPAEQPVEQPVELGVDAGPLAPGDLVMHALHGGDYLVTACYPGGKVWARALADGVDITLTAPEHAGGAVWRKARGVRPLPRVHDAITIDDVPGVWVVTHVPDQPAPAGPTDYAPDTRTPVGRVLGAMGYYRARRVFDGGDVEALPMVFGAAAAGWAHAPAALAPVGNMGVWFTAGNGPVVVPIAEQHIDDAPRCAERVRNWQNNNNRNVDAVVVVRVGDGWVDGTGRTLAPAAAPSTPAEVVAGHVHRATIEAGAAPAPLGRPAEISAPFDAVEQPAPVEAGPSPVDASTAPALPQVDDDTAPLGRRDLVTYNGSRYVIIRADSRAERARREGQVELFPGNVLPDHVPSGARGHWVEASACTRRLVLEWGMRHRDPVTGELAVVGPHPGRAFAEHAVEVGLALGERSAELVARVPGGKWAPAPMRTPAEREAEAAAYLAALD